MNTGHVGSGFGVERRPVQDPKFRSQDKSHTHTQNVPFEKTQRPKQVSSNQASHLSCSLLFRDNI